MKLEIMLCFVFVIWTTLKCPTYHQTYVRSCLRPLPFSDFSCTFLSGLLEGSGDLPLKQASRCWRVNNVVNTTWPVWEQDTIDSLKTNLTLFIYLSPLLPTPCPPSSPL